MTITHKSGSLLRKQFNSTHLTTLSLDKCLPFEANSAIQYARLVAIPQKTGRPISVENAQIAAIAFRNLNTVMGGH